MAQAALTSPMWLNSCGKLPSSSPVPASTSSASRPTSLTNPAARWVADGVRLFDHAQVALPEHTSEPAPTRWTRSTIYPDMWVDPDDDPRETGVATVDERSTLLDYLRR